MPATPVPILYNKKYLNTKKFCCQTRIRGTLYIKDANRHVNVCEAEEIKKEYRQQRRENILGTNVPTTNRQIMIIQAILLYRHLQ